jgi:hypothetical protein
MIAIALLVMGVSAPAGSKSKVRPSCSAWLARTAKGADTRSEPAWRDWTVSALADSCAAIPEGLRDAAVRVRGVKDRAQRARILAKAATAVLGEACAIPEPLADARKLAAACPLPPNLKFRLDESMLSDIRAVDYGLLNAMLRSLIGANEFGEEAQRVMLNFTLSAQILGEDARTGAQRKGVSHP